MGILNVTPDSFSDGGEHLDPRAAVARGLQMLQEGAVLVDVGGESTRPGAQPVPEDEELRRVMPVIEGLVDAGVPVSVDTYKPDVARRAVASGAVVINDVTGFEDPAMIEVAAGSDCGLVVMHMQGRPIDMHIDPRYEDVVSEVEEYLVGRADHLVESGISRDRLIIDPGLGFGKRPAHSLALLAEIDRLADHSLPVMVGASRKGFTGELVSKDIREARDLATAVITAVTFTRGASVFRVHEVQKSRDALRVADAIVASQ